MPAIIDDTENILGQFIVAAFRVKLELTEDQVYESVARHYVEGQPDRVIQVVGGEVQIEGAGKGAQEGDALLRTETYEITYWHKVNLDQHGWSQQALIETGNGIKLFMKQMRNVLKRTLFASDDGSNGIGLYLPLFYKGQTATFVEDEDRGIFYRTMTFTGSFGEILPTTAQTVTFEDVLPLIPAVE